MRMKKGEAATMTAREFKQRVPLAADILSLPFSLGLCFGLFAGLALLIGLS